MQPLSALVVVPFLMLIAVSTAVADGPVAFKRGDTVTVLKDGAEFALPGKPSQKLPLGTKITVMRTTDRAIGGFASIDGERSPGWIRISDVLPQDQTPAQAPGAKPEESPAAEAPATKPEPVAFEIEPRLGMVHHDLEFSPDGKLLLSAGMHYESPDIQLWSTADGREVRKLEGERWGTRNGAFSPDGKLVATANHGIRMWRVGSGERVWDSLELSPVHRTQFSPDGKTLAIGGAQGKVLLLDAATGERRSEIQAYSGWTFDLQFTAGGSGLVTIGVEEPRSGAIKVWEVATGKLLSEIGAGEIDANDVAISPDEKQAVTWARHRELQVWDLETGKPVGASWGDHEKILRAVAWSPDGRVIASGGEDRVVKLWDAQSHKPLLSLPVECQEILDLEFSPDGNLLAVGGRGGPVVDWNTAALLAGNGAEEAGASATSETGEVLPPTESAGVQ